VCPTVLLCMVVQCVPQLDFVNSRHISVAILWSGPKIRMLVIVDLCGCIIEIVTL